MQIELKRDWKLSSFSAPTSTPFYTNKESDSFLHKLNFGQFFSKISDDTKYFCD